METRVNITLRLNITLGWNSRVEVKVGLGFLFLFFSSCLLYIGFPNFSEMTKRSHFKKIHRIKFLKYKLNTILKNSSWLIFYLLKILSFLTIKKKIIKTFFKWVKSSVLRNIFRKSSQTKES